MIPRQAPPPAWLARWTAAASAYAPAYAQRQAKGADHPLTTREFAAYMDEKVIPRAKQNEGDFGEAPKCYQPRLTGVKLKAHRIGEKLISAGFRFSPVSNAIYKHFTHVSASMLHEAQFHVSEGKFDRLVKRFLAMAQRHGGQIEKRVALRKMSVDIGTMNKILLTLHASDLIEEELVARRKSIITLKAA